MKKPLAGYHGMLLASMLIFGTIGLFRRYLPVSSGILACVRGAIGAAALLPLRLQRHPARLGFKKTAILVLTGGLMGLNWAFLFEAYARTTVATATLCYYMAPTMVILLAPLMFGERLTAPKIAAAVVSLAGMVLVSGARGEIGWRDATGIFCGLGAAALYAAVIILNKKMPDGDSYQRTFVQLIAATVTMVPYVMFTGGFSSVSITPVTVALLVTLGIVHTGVAYALYFSALPRLKAQTVAVMSYLDPVTALLLSALILKEPLTVWGGIGAVMILGSAVFNARRE